MVVQAPIGVTEDDVIAALQVLLDRHAMLRLQVDDDGAGGWSLQAPEAGSVDAGSCLHTVDVLSDEALVQARSQLDPAAGTMLSALWVSSTRRLVAVVHHLAIDGVSWRILLEDLNLVWAQQRVGHPPVLPEPGTSFQRWAALLAEYAHRPGRGGVRRHLAAGGGDSRGVADGQPRSGHLGECRHAGNRSGYRDHPPLLGDVPAAFHAGVQDVLLIAFALAVAEFLGTGAEPVGIDVEGHGRDEELAADVDLSRTVGWFTAKYPVALSVGGLDWSQVVAGGAGLGAVVKDAKEYLRALPDGMTYGALRYLNGDVDLEGCGSADRVQLSRPPRRVGDPGLR